MEILFNHVFVCNANSKLFFNPMYTGVGSAESTVQPRKYGHQGDMPKCPYYRGVRIKRALRQKVTDTLFIDRKTEAFVFTAIKRYINCTLTVIKYNCLFRESSRILEAEQLLQNLLKRKILELFMQTFLHLIYNQPVGSCPSSSSQASR